MLRLLAHSQLYTTTLCLIPRLQYVVMRLFRSIEYLQTAQRKYSSLQNTFLKYSITADFVNKVMLAVHAMLA
jgi:hypothetical protein